MTRLFERNIDEVMAGRVKLHNDDLLIKYYELKQDNMGGAYRTRRGLLNSCSTFVENLKEQLRADGKTVLKTVLLKRVEWNACAGNRIQLWAVMSLPVEQLNL
jgi:hypothetical protein